MGVADLPVVSDILEDIRPDFNVWDIQELDRVRQAIVVSSQSQGQAGGMANSLVVLSRILGDEMD